MRRWWILCLVAACGSDAELTANERALAGDGLRSVDAEALLIATVEQSFSGTIRYTHGDDPFQALHAAATASVADADARLGACLTAALTPPAPASPVIDYTLAGCAIDGHTLDGTVTTTWMLDDAIRIVHALDLTIDAAEARGTIELDIHGPEAAPVTEVRSRGYAVSVAGAVLTGAWSVSHDEAGCGIKTGRGSITIGSGRTFERRDQLDYCEAEDLAGITGSLELARDNLALTVRLLGRGEAEVVTRGAPISVGVDALLD